MSFSAIQWPIAESPSSVQYSDAEQAQQINLLFGNSNADAGVLRGVLNELEVVASSPAAQSIDVKSGAALIDGRLILIESDQTLLLAPNASGNPRIDLVVATYIDNDYPTPAQLKVVQGSPGPSPGPPGLTQSRGTQWQIPLVEVYLANGYATVVGSDITDRRVWKNVVDRVEIAATNGGGSGLAVGTIGAWKSGSDQTFETSTTNDLIAGVVSAYVTNSGTAKLVTHGIAYIYVDGAVTRYDEVRASSSSAGQGSITGIGPVVGRALETTAAAGLCLCYVDIKNSVAKNKQQATLAATRSTTSTSFVLITDADLTITKRHENSYIRAVFNVVWADNTVAGANNRIQFYDNTAGSLIGHYQAHTTPSALFRVPMHLELNISGYGAGDSVNIQVHFTTTTGTLSIILDSLFYLEEVVE